MWNNIVCLCNVAFILSSEGFRYTFSKLYYKLYGIINTNLWDQFIINSCERLKNKNVFYIKAIQALSADNTNFSEKVRTYMRVMADKVPYKKNDYDLDHLKSVLQEKNITIGNVPIASGTISVVFKGSDDKQKEYAIKYKRKNIDKFVIASIDEMRFVITIINSLPYFNRFNLLPTFNENTKYINEQLSFIDEWNNIDTVYKANIRDKRYLIPKPYFKNITCTYPNIIVMQFLDGANLNELTNDNDKDRFCEIVAKFGLKSIFFNGFVHGDLHQGNCKFRINNISGNDADTESSCDEDEYDKETYNTPREQLILYDFGILCKINKTEQNHMYNALKYAFNDDYRNTGIYILDNIVQKNNNKLNETDRYCLIDDLEYWVSYCIGEKKLMEPSDVHKLSSILWKYKLKISDWFCKIIFAFAIHEAMAKSLSVNKTFLEYGGDMIKESEELFGDKS